jgi:hypothetical protein
MFQVSLEIAEELYKTHLKVHIDRLRQSIWFLIDWPYVDKVYRSSYNIHFSSKNNEYARDCIRLSLFDGEVAAKDFRSSEGVKRIQERFKGFMVLRPIVPGIVGRCVLAKEVLGDVNFVALEAEYPVSVNGVKLVAKGYPYSSQDAEVNTCAETALWTVVEYLRTIHGEYAALLPADIVNILKDYTPERELPSKGLEVEQISFALKKFGPASRIFSRAQYRPNKFRNMFSSYVSGGLPVIVAVQLPFTSHAMVAVGQERTTDVMIDALPASKDIDLLVATVFSQSGIQIFDNDEIPRKFVFIDDNMPVYSLGSFDTPTAEYWDDSWRRSEITHFIVPFHPEVHLEAVAAKQKFLNILSRPQLCITPNSSLFIRMFLSSSELFRDNLAKDPSISKVAKDQMLKAIMPGFVWVGEVSTKEMIKQKKGMGIFVFDATDLDLVSATHSFIGGLFQDKYYYMNDINQNIVFVDAPFTTFNIFTNNLNGF